PRPDRAAGRGERRVRDRHRRARSRGGGGGDAGRRAGGVPPGDRPDQRRQLRRQARTVPAPAAPAPRRRRRRGPGARGGRRRAGVIVETVVTTLDPAGRPHFAAMGVVWGDERLTIRPYVATRTYRHLVAARAAVVNVTDDVLAFARSALEHGPLPARPATRVPGVVLADACHWREVEVEAVTVPPAGADGRRRAEIVARVVATGTGRPF